MTTSNVASAVNSSSKVQYIEEISIIIAAKDLTPTMMSYDFLKFSGVVAKEWELSQQPVLNPNYAQLNFKNGVSISAQPRSVTISESLSDKKTENLVFHTVAAKYIEKLPHAEYVGLSLSPKILLPFPNSPKSVRQYITGTLLGSGAWKRIGKIPVQAGINLMYYLDRCQLTISVSEAQLKKPQEQPITAILFSGNFNYNVNPESEESANRTTQIFEFLNNWQTDIKEFRDIVNQKFLDSDSTESKNSIGETTLFPGQTL
jgi:hypothetical protein